MAKNTIEKTWKSVNLNQYSSASMVQEATSGGYGINQDVSYSYNWFQRLISNHGKRKTKLQRYEQMDQTVDIARALDVIAEDVSSVNADEEEIFKIEVEQDSDIKKNTIKTLEKMKKRWMQRTGFDIHFFDYVRETCKNGCEIFMKNSDGSLKRLEPERIHGYILDASDDTRISHYLYNDRANYTNKEGDSIGISSTAKYEEYEKIPVDDLVVLKVGEGPFGKSVLDDVFKVWRKLQLLEDSIVIYRIVRAPERRVFYIDIGDTPVHRAESYMERQKMRLRQKQVSREGEGELSTEFNPHSMQEDYYIPQTAQGRGSRVETLNGGQNLDELADLQYFNKKLALGLRIPPGYMDTYSSESGGQQYQDGRVGSMYVAEMRYLGFVRRIQDKLAKELFKNFMEFCKKNDVRVPEEGITFTINSPQSYAVFKENEKNQQVLNVAQSAENMSGLSKRFTMRKYFQMDENEIIENEYMILKEKGLTDDEIKGLEYHVRMNIVYGDASKAEEAGVKVGGGEEGGFGGRRF